MTLMAAWLPTNCAKGVTMIGIAELGSDLDYFLQNGLHFVFFAEHLELMAQVGNHAAGDLMAVPGLVVFARRADGETFLLRYATEVLFDRRQHFFVH